MNINSIGQLNVNPAQFVRSPAPVEKWNETAVKTFRVAGLILLMAVLSPVIACVAATKYSANRVRSVARLFTSHKEIALIIQASEDPQRAFQSKVNFWLRDSYTVTHKFVSSIDQFAEAITSLPRDQQIKVLWIRAHGAPNVIKLGKPKYLNKTLMIDDKFLHQGNLDKLRIPFERLAPDATIVIGACSTGQKVKNGKCIAERIASIAPGRLVCAPSEVMSHSIVTQAHPLKIMIPKVINRSRWLWLARFERNLEEALLTYTGINFMTDICAKYKSEAALATLIATQTCP